MRHHRTAIQATGIDTFMQTLRETNVLEELIRNEVRWRQARPLGRDELEHSPPRNRGTILETFYFTIDRYYTITF